MAVHLSQASINSLRKKIESISDSLAYVSYKTVEELATTGEDVAKVFDSTSPKSGEVDNIFRSTKPKSQEKFITAKVIMSGPNAIYEEFGTGEEGASDAHPLKWQTASGAHLNPYNSGPTIRINPSTGRHYWFYKPMAGRDYYGSTGYTEGIPAGKQMYYTIKHLNKIKKSVAVKHANNTIQEINKAINKFD